MSLACLHRLEQTKISEVDIFSIQKIGRILAEILWLRLVLFDDFSCGKRQEQHDRRLNGVYERCLKVNLKPNAKKC